MEEREVAKRIREMKESKEDKEEIEGRYGEKRKVK